MILCANRAIFYCISLACIAAFFKKKTLSRQSAYNGWARVGLRVRVRVRVIPNVVVWAVCEIFVLTTLEPHLGCTKISDCCTLSSFEIHEHPRRLTFKRYDGRECEPNKLNIRLSGLRYRYCGVHVFHKIRFFASPVASAVSRSTSNTTTVDIMGSVLCTYIYI